MRTVNGVELPEIYGWRYGEYLITTDTFAASETGIGYFTVARGEWGITAHAVNLIYVATAHSLGDAVTVADCDREKTR